MRRSDFEDLPSELVGSVRKTITISHSYLEGLGFIVKNSQRNPNFSTNHLLSPLCQDLLQSAVSIYTLVAEGLINVARRELRFLLEASVKIAAIQHSDYEATVAEKLDIFDKELSSPSISIKKKINLALISDLHHDAFNEEVGRLYGLTSNYVHLSPIQVLQSIEAARQGITAGRERPIDIDNFNLLTERAMAASLVLLFHSVDYSVAGEWLVEHDGTSIDWYFMKSRFIAAMDESFDYKAEREKRLPEIQASRTMSIEF